ncbi:MAG: shikimate kinase [Clostridia bacterium]|nr:shikimate kinase [Clostridia bacterium]
MKLVIIIGSGAVGKMTVGQELMKITDLRLFHNHMMIEPVIEIFNSFNGKVISRLREVVLDEFVQSENEGMIFTYMWAFDMPSDFEYVMHVASKFDEAYCVELIADQSVRLERNKTENRLRNKASKRDTAASDLRVINEDTNHRLVSKPGEIPFENYMRIDNTNLSPDVVAQMIKEKFSL